MSSQLTNITPFKAELQTNKLLLVENISFQQRRNMETHTHTHLHKHIAFLSGVITGAN